MGDWKQIAGEKKVRLRGGGKGKYRERDGKTEREEKRRNRARGDREKPVGVEPQATRDEEVRNGMRKGLPGGPVVKTLHFQCRRHGFHPWLGN